MRHTCAMATLQATQDIRKVSLWLGHANPATTEIYTRTDPSEKLEAVEAITPPHLRKGQFRPPDKLLELLRVQTVVMESESVKSAVPGAGLTRTPHYQQLHIRHVMVSSPLRVETATVRSAVALDVPTGSIGPAS